jgi:hypothetical protein
LDAAQVTAFDADLARLLAERFPEPLLVPHRIWAIASTREPRDRQPGTEPAAM